MACERDLDSEYLTAIDSAATDIRDAGEDLRIEIANSDAQRPRYS